jgi:CRP/FNR family cyclic AMP-dependent transcriptional regulator
LSEPKHLATGTDDLAHTAAPRVLGRRIATARESHVVPARCGVSLLDELPELAAELQPDAESLARALTTVPAIRLERGCWSPLGGRARPPDGTALILLSGVMLRETAVADRAGAELLGVGDLFHPWADEGPTSLGDSSRWIVVETATAGVIDQRFIARTVRWPQVGRALTVRCGRRSRALAAQLLACQLRRIDDRLLVTFALLAERFGRVRADGIFIPIPLPHGVIGQLVGAQRPSVTTGLRRLRESGMLTRVEGGWLLDQEAAVEGLVDPLRRRTEVLPGGAAGLPAVAGA